MDHLQIHDSGFTYGREESIVSAILDHKLENATESTEENIRLCEVRKGKKIALPAYSFSIEGFRKGKVVEYDVKLIETFKVFKKTIKEEYKFRTRYSKLHALQDKVKGAGFPSKRLFGNKNEEVICQRQKDLEEYLNKLCENPHPELLKFILQIKQCDLIEQSKIKFLLPN